MSSPFLDTELDKKPEFLSNAEVARSWLESQGIAAFGTAWPDVRPLLFSVSGWPVGVTHVSHFDSLTSPPLKVEDHNDLTFAYVSLAVAFFCMDRQFDKDKQINLEPLVAPMFIASAVARIIAVKRRNFALDEVDSGDVTSLLTTFFRAMLEEKKYAKREVPFSPEDEFFHVSSRSAIVIYFVELIRKIKGLPHCEATSQALAEVVYYLQLGDDWGDWREDFQSNNWSTFLRKAISGSEQGCENESQMEKTVYLSGVYEEWGQSVVDGLANAHASLIAIYGSRYETFGAVIERTIQRGHAQIENFQRIKQGLKPMPIPNVIQ